MKRTRPPYDSLSPELQRKARINARSMAHIYLRRGKIKRGPCEQCQAEPAEMHHDDYDKPFAVRWLCRPCHLAHHDRENNPRFYEWLARGNTVPALRIRTPFLTT